MNYTEAQFMLSSMFGMYILGWGCAYIIHVVKIFMEKI